MRWSRSASTLLLTAMLAAGALAILSVLGRGTDLIRALRAFPVGYLVPALALASLNYALRFLRWHLYLRRCGLAPEARRSAAVFLSGLAMSVTPGKFGELFKSALLKESDGVPVSLSAPIVVVERLMDLAAVAGLAALGAVYYSVGRTAVIAAAVLIAAVVTPLAVSPSLAAALAPWLARRRMLARMAGADQPSGAAPVQGDAAPAELESSAGSGAMNRAATVFAQLLRGRALVMGLTLGALAWLAECLALYAVLAGLGEHHVAFLATVFVYLLATLAGALSFLPGGLGAAEASMAGLLIGFGVAGGTAAAATLVVRACTLWFAVLVGLAGYAWYRALVRSLSAEAPRRTVAESARG